MLICVFVRGWGGKARMPRPPVEDKDNFPKLVLSSTTWVSGIDFVSGFAASLAFIAESLFLLTLFSLLLADCGSTYFEPKLSKCPRQEDRELETSLGYVAKHYLKKNVFYSFCI